MTTFEELVQDHEAAGAGYRQAIAREIAARQDRLTFRRTYVASVLGQVNPLTQKPHSATSAETECEGLPEYQSLLRAELEAQLDKLAREEDSRVTGWIIEQHIAVLRTQGATV
jgi:hypothetical protein